MKRLILLAASVGIAQAQYAGSASGSTTAAAEMNGKINHQSAAGAPSSRNCTQGKDLYTNTSNNDLYKCTVTGAPGTWALVVPGAGSLPDPSTIYTSTNALGSVALTNNPEPCVRGTLAYTAFQTAAVTQKIAIATVPANFSPRSIRVETTTPFAGTAITSLLASVVPVSGAFLYLQPFEVTTGGPAWATDNAAGDVASLASHALYVKLDVNQGSPPNLSALTAGAFTVSVCGVIQR